MDVLLAAIVGSVVTGLVVSASLRGHIDDLRTALTRERRMRRDEEARAESLSDALFGRTRTRHRSNTDMQN